MKGLGVLLIVLGFIIPAVRIVKSIQFDQECCGYLKQAADANTVELAYDRITKALDYIEKNNLTSGYTSILYKTEEDNIEFWYNNIKACSEELKECQEGTQLEKSNVLMKVRESLTDEGEKGTELTVPPGISVYPNNIIYGFLLGLSFVFFTMGSWLIVVYKEDEL